MPRKGKRSKKNKKKAPRVSATPPQTQQNNESHELDLQMDRLQLVDSPPSSASDSNDISNPCQHGRVVLPDGHVCNQFLEVFFREMENKSVLDALTATKLFHPNVWEDANKLNWVISFLSSVGAEMLLQDGEQESRVFAVAASLLENHIAYHLHQTRSRPKFDQTYELINADRRMLVCFFNKHISCHCLSEEYNRLKSMTKMGACCNNHCPLPGKRVARGKMLTCTGCRFSHYCSSECQLVHWSSHKQFCSRIR